MIGIMVDISPFFSLLHHLHLDIWGTDLGLWAESNERISGKCQNGGGIKALETRSN